MEADTRELRRTFLFSDTYGRHKNFYLQDDADAVISTHFRSFPMRKNMMHVDIYGREGVTAHIVRLVFHLHDEVMKAAYFTGELKESFQKSLTGIFINAAPRTGKDQNGAPFYIATSGNIRIITTDPKGLSSVKEKIETLSHLPNVGNRMFSETEQFRSSYAARLLYPHHGEQLTEDNVDDVIPDYPEDRWELSYVDRFGNILTYTKNPEKKWDEIVALQKQKGSQLKVIIGDTAKNVSLGTSLKDADPGSLVMYPNGDIEILRKWKSSEDDEDRLKEAAFFQFKMPKVGASVTVK